MSTLVIDTIQGKTTAGSVNVRGEGSNNTNLQQGLVKAWAMNNQVTTHSNLDSFNVASVTDVKTGGTTENFTNNMANGNYAVVSSGDDKQDGGSIFVHNIDDSVDQATTGYGTSFKKYSYALTDNNQNASSMVLGDLS